MNDMNRKMFLGNTQIVERLSGEKIELLGSIRDSLGQSNALLDCMNLQQHLIDPRNITGFRA